MATVKLGRHPNDGNEVAKAIERHLGLPQTGDSSNQWLNALCDHMNQEFGTDIRYTGRYNYGYEFEYSTVASAKKMAEIQSESGL